MNFNARAIYNIVSKNLHCTFAFNNSSKDIYRFWIPIVDTIVYL